MHDLAMKPPSCSQRQQARDHRLSALDHLRSHVQRNTARPRPGKQAAGAILRGRGPHRPVAFHSIVKRLQTEDPITVALKSLMRERGLTFRALAELTRAHDAGGRGVTYTYLCALTSGREQPSLRSLEVIAATLDVDSDYFPEYRLARLPAELDPKRAGFPAAWRRYLELAR